MKRALVLNADYAPLHFISDIDAFILVYKEVAEIVELDGRLSVWENNELTSPGRRWPCPATVRLLNRVNKRAKPSRFRKKILFIRDNWTCQYCGVMLNCQNVTIDHVFPKSRGGATSWKNCVTSCKTCNKNKADKTLHEASMKLIKPAVEPSYVHFWNSAKRNNEFHNDWELFVPS